MSRTIGTHKAWLVDSRLGVFSIGACKSQSSDSRLGSQAPGNAAHLVVKQAMIGDSRLALSQGAGLIKDNGLDLVGPFQRIPPLDEYAAGGGHPSTHHDGGGGGQAQGTRAGHHQH